MNGKASRRKGHDFERRIARTLRSLWAAARRGLQYQDGHTCADVEGTDFHIECKAQQRPDIWGALRQAADKTEHRLPMAIVKKDGQRIVVAMYFDDWLARELRRRDNEAREASNDQF